MLLYLWCSTQEVVQAPLQGVALAVEVAAPEPLKLKSQSSPA